MKRTNLVLDESLLEEATRLSGEKTYSAAVNRAMADFVDRARARRILDLTGKGLWDGDLGAMRADSAMEPEGSADGPKSRAGSRTSSGKTRRKR